MIFLRLLDLSFRRTVDRGNGIDWLEGAGTNRSIRSIKRVTYFTAAGD